MFKVLINLGIVAIPFIVTTNRDMRLLQLEIAASLAAILGLSVLYHGGLKPFRNKFLLTLMAYLFIHILFAPKPQIKMLGMDVENFWAFKPMLYILCFFILLYVIAGRKFNAIDIHMILKCMMYTAFFQGVYCLLQYFNVDQWFALSHHDVRGRVAGFLGNPTIVSQFVAVAIPLTLYFRKYYMTIIMIAGVLVCRSQMANVAMIGSIVIYYALRGRKSLIISGVITTLAVSVLLAGQFTDFVPKFFNDSSRFGHWPTIIKEINTPLGVTGGAYPITGIGMGSFKYTYHIKHKNNYHQAHNDYLEFAYNTGIIGLSILLLAIFYMVRMNLRSCRYVYRGSVSRYRRALLACFAVSALGAIGAFVWQIGPVVLYTVIIVGLLHNEKEILNAKV